MNFRHIEVFFAVMTSGTVTAAAKQLGISQPSVTTTLKHAESSLGIKLFIRESGRLVPTMEARILFEEARRAHEALGAMVSLAARLKEGQGGHVRIAATSSLSLAVLPDAISYFQKKQPGYSYAVSTLNTEEILSQLDVRKSSYHLGFAYGSGNYEGVLSKRLGQSELYCIVPSTWPEAHQDQEIDISILRGKPYISAFDDTPLGQICKSFFLTNDVTPQVVAQVHSHLMAGTLVQRGLGYAILDSMTVRTLLQTSGEQDLVVRKLIGIASLPIVAVYPTSRTYSRGVATFVECFQRSLQKANAHLRDVMAKR